MEIRKTICPFCEELRVLDQVSFNYLVDNKEIEPVEDSIKFDGISVCEFDRQFSI